MDDHIKSTIETYDRIAPFYKITATPELRKWEENSMEKFIQYLSGNNVLVCGCGDGRDSRFLSSKGLAVTSIDLSRGMLDEAGKEDPQGNYRLYDMRNIDAIGMSFDGIWASGCLYHLKKEEFETFLVRCNVILNKEGIIYLNMKEGTGEEYLESPKSKKYPGGVKARELLAGKRYYSYYSRDELLSYLKGYRIIHQQRLKFAENGSEFWVKNQRR